MESIMPNVVLAYNKEKISNLPWTLSKIIFVNQLKMGVSHDWLNQSGFYFRRFKLMKI